MPCGTASRVDHLTSETHTRSLRLRLRLRPRPRRSLREGKVRLLRRVEAPPACSMSMSMSCPVLRSVFNSLPSHFSLACHPCFLCFRLVLPCRPHRLFCDVDAAPSARRPRHLILVLVLVPANPNLQTRPSPCSCTPVALPNLSTGPNTLDMAVAAIAMNRPRSCPLAARSFSRSRKIRPWRFPAPRPSGKEYPLPALVAVLLRVWSLPNQETSGLKWAPPSTVCIKTRSKRCKLQRPRKQPNFTPQSLDHCIA
ncbi:uncharacterized protein J3D65DRAFT_324215 [Phyllosticta citribraziliensis]|uniref:Uncharacterized protein n=1 Tax=Phyllosticta citribraziliensis TaxID=989973 RepID=A0ABR1LT56_9PEZI